MKKTQKPKALRADVGMDLVDKEGLTSVMFEVISPDGSPLTGQQILEAISEALVLYYPNCPVEDFSQQEYDA